MTIQRFIDATTTEKSLSTEEAVTETALLENEKKYYSAILEDLIFQTCRKLGINRAKLAVRHGFYPRNFQRLDKPDAKINKFLGALGFLKRLAVTFEMTLPQFLEYFAERKNGLARSSQEFLEKTFQMKKDDEEYEVFLMQARKKYGDEVLGKMMGEFLYSLLEKKR